MTKKNIWFARHKVLTVILALIIIGAVAGAAGGGNKPSSNNNNSSGGSSQSTTKPAMAKIGEAARDGKFEFKISDITCGASSVGDNPYLTKTAQGQFCMLTVTIKNIGNEKQSLFSSNQKLLDANNKEYSADDTATLYHTPGGQSWFTDINPGNVVVGAIVFDVPKDVTPTVAELHDSAFSGGVKVQLQ